MDIAQLSKEDRDNLKLEIKLHSRLNHPNIIRFYDCFQVGNKVYILLEYASNGALFFYIHTQEGIPEHLALRFLRDTTLALKYLHDQKIIHRDLKPENLLLDDQFNIKLCDFGWATWLQHEDDFRTSICGTYEYMPPEVCFRQTHTTKADIWSLGILLYEMTHGHPPYAADTLENIKQEFEQKNIEIYSNFSQGIRTLLKELLRMDSSLRPDATQLLAHPVLVQHEAEFSKPLTQSDFAILIKNYLRNTDHGKTMEVAKAAENAVNQLNDARHKPKAQPQEAEVPETFFEGVKLEENEMHFDLQFADLPHSMANSKFFSEGTDQPHSEQSASSNPGDFFKDLKIEALCLEPDKNTYSPAPSSIKSIPPAVSRTNITTPESEGRESIPPPPPLPYASVRTVEKDHVSPFQKKSTQESSDKPSHPAPLAQVTLPPPLIGVEKRTFEGMQKIQPVEASVPASVVSLVAVKPQSQSQPESSKTTASQPSVKTLSAAKPDFLPSAGPSLKQMEFQLPPQQSKPTPLISGFYSEPPSLAFIPVFEDRTTRKMVVESAEVKSGFQSQEQNRLTFGVPNHGTASRARNGLHDPPHSDPPSAVNKISQKTPSDSSQVKANVFVNAINVSSSITASALKAGEFPRQVKDSPASAPPSVIFQNSIHPRPPGNISRTNESSHIDSRIERESRQVRDSQNMRNEPAPVSFVNATYKPAEPRILPPTTVFQRKVPTENQRGEGTRAEPPKFKYVVFNGLLVKKPVDEPQQGTPMPIPVMPKSFSAGQVFGQKLDLPSQFSSPMHPFTDTSRAIRLNSDTQALLSRTEAADEPRMVQKQPNIAQHMVFQSHNFTKTRSPVASGSPIPQPAALRK